MEMLKLIGEFLGGGLLLVAMIIIMCVFLIAFDSKSYIN
jgi:hypothetical protein